MTKRIWIFALKSHTQYTGWCAKFFTFFEKNFNLSWLGNLMRYRDKTLHRFWEGFWLRYPKIWLESVTMMTLGSFQKTSRSWRKSAFFGRPLQAEKGLKGLNFFSTNWAYPPLKCAGKMQNRGLMVWRGQSKTPSFSGYQIFTKNHDAVCQWFSIFSGQLPLKLMERVILSCLKWVLGFSCSICCLEQNSKIAKIAKFLTLIFTLF